MLVENSLKAPLTPFFFFANRVLSSLTHFGTPHTGASENILLFWFCVDCFKEKKSRKSRRKIRLHFTNTWPKMEQKNGLMLKALNCYSGMTWSKSFNLSIPCFHSEGLFFFPSNLSSKLFMREFVVLCAFASILKQKACFCKSFQAPLQYRDI